MRRHVAELETKLRFVGSQFIESMGILLKLYVYSNYCATYYLDRPQVVMATASVLFHQFYYKASFAESPITVTFISYFNQID